MRTAGNRLNTWLAGELRDRFEQRVLTIDAPTADTWGFVMARGQARGRSIATMDGFLAATAIRHDLTLVTRNVTDFEHLDIRLINPWRDG
jgi:toxin FitB